MPRLKVSMLKDMPIQNCEDLFRGHPNLVQEKWDYAKNEPRPSLFRDKAGTSVQRNAKDTEFERSDGEVINKLSKKLSNGIEHVVKINALTCRSGQVEPKAVHNETDEYHSELHNGQASCEVVIPLVNAAYLVRNCVLVYSSSIE